MPQNKYKFRQFTHIALHIFALGRDEVVDCSLNFQLLIEEMIGKLIFF